MIVNNPTVTKKQHYKMYKAKKQWICAGLTVASLAMSMQMYGIANAHADTTNASNATGNNTSDVTNGGNAVSQTTATNSSASSSQTIPVNVDHSNLDQAIQNAKDNNIQVNDPTTTSKTVDQDHLNEAVNDTRNDYNNQAQAINSQVDKYKQQSQVKNQYNGTTDDHSELDKSVQNATKTPGITVIKDDDHSSSFAATAENAKKWSDTANADYANQKQAIDNAIAKQEQDNADYDAQMSKLNQGSNAQIISSSDVSQALDMNSEKDAHAQIELLNPHLKIRDNWDDSWNISSDLNPYTNKLNGDLVRVTYTNLSHSTYDKKPLRKIVITFSDSTPTGVTETGYPMGPINTSGTTSRFLHIFKNPVMGDYHCTEITATYQFYDSQGNLIDFANKDNAWLSFGSLNVDDSFKYNGLDGGISEAFKVIDGGIGKQLAGSSVSLHPDGYFYAPFDNYNDPSAPKDWDTGSSPDAYYGAAVVLLNSDHVSIRQAVHTWGSWDNSVYSSGKVNNVNDAWLTASTTIPPTKLQRKTSTIHYHYDVANPRFTEDAIKPIDYNLTDLSTTVTPSKDWEENGTTTNDKTYTAGDKAHAKLTVTVNNVDQYDGGLKTFALDENYSNFKDKVTVTGATVKENGKDATDQYTLSVKDGHIIMTRKTVDGFTGGTVELDPVFTINKDFAGSLVNQGSVFINDLKYDVTPETVNVVTPSPKKDIGVGDVSGKITDSIDGKTVANGSTETFALTTPDLPSNRAKKITDRSMTDTLDSHLAYKGFKAYVDNGGQLEDVTSHIKLTQSGQTLTFTEDDYLLNRYNADLTKAVSTPIVDITAVVHGDNIKVNNTYTLTQNGVTFNSNEVNIDTPDSPKPTKSETNQQGVSIDGKTMLPGDTGIFNIKADYDQYKNIVASQDAIDNGFYLFDDYPEAALTPNTDAAVVRDSKGNVVSGMTVKVYNSLSEAPTAVQAAAKKIGFAPKGKFLVVSPADMQSYYKNYVQTGDSVTAYIPMTVNDGFSGSYENQAYEVDFGNGYATNIVHNTVPKPNPHKDAVTDVDSSNSLDGKTINVGDVFDYKLAGDTLTNLGDGVTEYGLHDDYDQTHDQSTGQVVVLLNTDTKLKDGTVMKKGTNIAQYCTITQDTVNGKIDIEVNKDFLAKVDPSGSFGATAYLQMKRIKSGKVKNTFVETINGKNYNSNTVTTNTPEPPAPKETPKPTPTPAPTTTPENPKPIETPQLAAVASPATPQEQAKKLPQTGNSGWKAVVAGLMTMLIALGSLGSGRNKRTA